MKALYELAEMVHNTKVKEVELVQENRSENSPLSALLNGILNQEFNSDQEAAQKVLKVDAADQSYQRLRRKLRRGLLNAVFFFDLPHSDYNERQRAYHESCKIWAAAKILLAKNANYIGIELCHKLLKKAEKFDFTDLIMDITRILRLHYATREGNIKKYELYNDLFKQCEKVWIEENLAEELYMELVLRYVNSQTILEETHSMAIEFYKQIEDSLAKHKSFRLHLCGMLIQQVIHSTKYDWEGMINLCQESIQFFLNKPYKASVPLQIAYHHQLIAYTQLLRFEEGQKAATSCLEYLEPGSFNWFKHQEYYFLLCMNTREYQQAFEIFKETTTHRRVQFLSAAAAEVWKIYEAYLYYLSSNEELVLPDEDQTLSRFRIYRFLNDTPIFSKDKKGMYIPILIIQILITLKEKKYNQAQENFENIDRFCSRYLRQGETFRSNCFIKMLLSIPACNFHREAVMRKTAKLKKRLESDSNKFVRAEIEIIPYEKLWDYVLESLSNKAYRARKS